MAFSRFFVSAFVVVTSNPLGERRLPRACEEKVPVSFMSSDVVGA